MLKTLTATGAPPALQAARTALDNLLLEINAHADEQADPIEPRTQERDLRFSEAAEATHVVARLVRGHALAAQLVELAGQVDIPPTHLRHGRFTHRLQAMRRVHAAASGSAPELAVRGLTPELLADLTTKIAAAETAMVGPRSQVAARHGATASLGRRFEELGRLLSFTLDPLLETLGRTDPDAYSRYLTARRVIDRPGSHVPAAPSAPAESGPPVATSAPAQPALAA